MSLMQQNRKNKILLGQDNNALTWLLIINAVVFVIIGFLWLVYFINYDTPMEINENFHLQITDWISLPANADTLATRPWTVLTYMFAHESLWQMIGTLLWLWGFGYLLQDLTGNSKLIPVYLYGGIAGAIVFILMSNLVPATNVHLVPLFGGGAAVTAIAVATTTVAPNYRLFPMIYGGIPIWVVTALFLIFDFAFIGSASGSIAAAHIAGGLMGFIFVWQMNRGNDMGGWMLRFYNWSNDLFNPEKKYREKPVKLQRFYKSPRTPFEKTPKVTQQKLDELLDKINQQGYDSLTAEEKEYLKKASQQDM